MEGIQWTFYCYMVTRHDLPNTDTPTSQRKLAESFEGILELTYSLRILLRETFKGSFFALQAAKSNLEERSCVVGLLKKGPWRLQFLCVGGFVCFLFFFLLHNQLLG